MNVISFELVTPEGILYTGNIRYINAPGTEGAFGVFPNHVPFFTLLKNGIVDFITDDHSQREYFAISNGIFEFYENKMLILAEDAVSGKNIDLAEEKKNEKYLRQEMEKSGTTTELQEKLKSISFRIKSAELYGKQTMRDSV